MSTLLVVLVGLADQLNIAGALEAQDKVRAVELEAGAITGCILHSSKGIAIRTL